MLQAKYSGHLYLFCYVLFIVQKQKPNFSVHATPFLSKFSLEIYELYLFENYVPSQPTNNVQI